MKHIDYCLVGVFVAAPVLAQTQGTFLLISTNTVSPSSPSTTIEIWAAWQDPGRQYHFGAGDYDLFASDGVFYNPINILNGPLSSTGLIAGNTVSGANNGQIHLPPTIPLPPSMLDNPVLLATYEWTTTEFSTRTVDLLTKGTTMFIVGDNVTRNVFQLVPQEFTAGLGFINIVPTPSSGLAVGLALCAVARRRRA